ncbi:protein FAM207A [Sitophilus oryzae]|uniref:Protein FAM207A n=1 Tax=Sitophilus oryzae TaxID=7048 RepID=A0A6J2YDN8_SITOR|nr:protein FAM207A [Sitophilus oryzae]
MGKVKRLRQKFHNACRKQNDNLNNTISFDSKALSNIELNTPTENIFSGINIDIEKLTNKLNDDGQSGKSYKSLKTELQESKTISKTEKLKIRRQVLLKKIDSLNQMKKEAKIRKKRKTISIIGDTNPLHDALPSLESLLKSHPKSQDSKVQAKKKRGIEKAKVRKKQLVQGIKIFNAVLNNKHFQKDPKQAISQHIQNFVNLDKQKAGRTHS